MPRVRRLRREAPTLELLAATLPELRLGLSDSGARTLAYEVFEKLGYGAVAVTHTSRVLAFVGARGGRDAHRAARAPGCVWASRLSARGGGDRAAAAQRWPSRRARRLRDRRRAARRRRRRPADLARRPALRAATALRARRLRARRGIRRAEGPAG